MQGTIRRRWLSVAIASLLVAGAAQAQNTSSSMSGRILGTDGAPAAGATVQIVHVPSGTTRVVTTDADGRFRAQGLRVGGPFDVTAKTASGFAERDDVFLQLAQDTSLDLSLAASASTGATQMEGVQVRANASDVAM
ncbi:MAG: carboxypeptidase-like regulatory domain-containing protein, partial [Luteibacter sp.]